MTKRCKHCSNEFEVKREWQSFCSVSCRNAFHASIRSEVMKMYRLNKEIKHEPTNQM
jgi:hypothetical protein